jgi:hypothetical protein
VEFKCHVRHFQRLVRTETANLCDARLDDHWRKGLSVHEDTFNGSDHCTLHASASVVSKVNSPTKTFNEPETLIVMTPVSSMLYNLPLEL